MNTALEKRLKRQVIGKPHRFLAVIPLGFEQTFINELEYIRRQLHKASVATNEVGHNRAEQLELEQSESTKTSKLQVERRADEFTHRHDRNAALDAEGVKDERLEATIAEQPHIVGDGKVEFTAKITEAWKIVAYSRIANRVLMHIADFKAENFREFEKKASEVPWELYLDDKCENRESRPSELGHDRDQHLVLEQRESTKTSNSIVIHVTCKHSRLYHSDAIAERLQKIIEDTPALKPIVQKQEPRHARPDRASIDSRLSPSSEDRRKNDEQFSQHLYVNFLDDRCTIWLDLAGEELYKRGFERFVNDAPLKETIAAAMLFEAIHLSQKIMNPIGASRLQDDRNKNLQDDTALTTNHQPLITIIDPMSGSGTFSLEAACIANNIIPGVCRDFALKHQPAFKEASWKHILGNRFQVTGFKIFSSDISERSIEIIKHNVECSPLANITPTPINPQLKDFFSYTAQEIANISAHASTSPCDGDKSNESQSGGAPIILLNPPYGKRLDFDAPKLYTKIGKKLAELAHDLKTFNKSLTIAILAPKDDSRPGSKFTCTANLLRECPTLAPNKNSTAKLIETSHGGFSLNVFITRI